MISEVTKLVLEVLKLAPRYLIALGLIAAVLLFGSAAFLKRLGVYEFTQNNRTWLGLTLIASALLFLVSISADAIQWIKAWWGRRKLSRLVKQRLHRLTEDEKQILRYYVGWLARST